MKTENVKYLMTREQQDKIDQPTATGNDNAYETHPYYLTRRFHEEMLMDVPSAPIIPSVSLRERRLRLILEEYLELCKAMGFALVAKSCSVNESQGSLILGGNSDKMDAGCLTDARFHVEHIEGSRYDVVETADGLGDLNVVVNGTSVDFGIHMPAIDYEIFQSNMTKLDPETGKPIVNHCTKCGPNPANPYLSTCECGDVELWLTHDAPLGKILKPEGFTKPNIPATLYQHQERGE